MEVQAHNSADHNTMNCWPPELHASDLQDATPWNELSDSYQSEGCHFEAMPIDVVRAAPRLGTLTSLQEWHTSDLEGFELDTDKVEGSKMVQIRKNSLL